MTNFLDDESVRAISACLLSSAPKTALAALETLTILSSNCAPEAFKRSNFLILDAMIRHVCACLKNGSPLLNDNVLKSISIFVNLSAESSEFAETIIRLMNREKGLLVKLISLSSTQEIGIRAVQLLANLSRHCALELFEIFSEEFPSVSTQLLKFLNSVSDDKDADRYDYYGYILMNISTLPLCREKISKDDLPLLIPLLGTNIRPKRRFCAVNIVYNLSHDAELHSWLLSECWKNTSMCLSEDAFLSAILAPLADANDSLSDEETERLPISLQYFDGKRETAGIIRMKLIETLYQFCATKIGREMLRAKGVYALMREMDKWCYFRRGEKPPTNALSGDIYAIGKMIGDFPHNNNRKMNEKSNLMTKEDKKLMFENVDNSLTNDCDEKYYLPTKNNKDDDDDQENDFEAVLHALIGILIRQEAEMGILDDKPTFSLKDLHATDF